MYPDANVVLTDLGEAQDICERNISRNSSKCSFQEFDWDDLVSAPKGHWDLVAVTDCTYNPSAYPALLNALKAVTRAGTQILLAHKYRDSSEREFFTLFCESPLYKVEQDTTLNYFSQPVRVIIARRR
jgi:predicted nicotinamide N-methyase